MAIARSGLKAGWRAPGSSPGFWLSLCSCGVVTACLAGDEGGRALSLEWDKEMLSIRGKHLPGGELQVWYIEAFCRPGSTRRDWHQTVIPHTTKRIEASPDGRRIKLRSTLEDGVIVDHEITVGSDEVDFRVVANNPTRVKSLVHWAQPCIRVDRYAGVKPERNSEAYLPRCFIEVGGSLVRLPIAPWSREAVYTPGQVWCPDGVSREDVNPRPLSAIVPSSGLIGCVSADGKELVATAWEPYQELFQGVIVCVHSDFRIGGLEPGESKTARGKIYLMPADFPALRARYRRDFPGQSSASPAATQRGAVEEADRVWLGRARYGVPAQAPRRAREVAVRRLRVSRGGAGRDRVEKRRTSHGLAGGAGGLHARNSLRQRRIWPPSPGSRGLDITSCVSTSRPAPSIGLMTTPQS